MNPHHKIHILHYYQNISGKGIGKNSEPAKQLSQFPEYKYHWKMLRRIPNKVTER